MRILLLSVLRLQIYHRVRWGFLSYTSSLFPTVNKLGRSSATSVINSPWSVAAKFIALAAGTVHTTQWSHILAQNRNFCLSHLHSTPPLRGGGSRRNIAMPFGMEKLGWCGYPMVKKVWKYVYSFWQNVRTWRTHRHTDRHTAHDSIGRACIASRGKNCTVNEKNEHFYFLE